MKDIKEFLESKKPSAVHSIVEAAGENKIYFPTPGSFAIYVCELQGQVSDGYWENSRPMNHWKWIGNTEPEIVKGKEGYTGPKHRIKYSTEWLRKYVKKALKGNGGDYDWTIRVFKFAKLASVTPENMIKDIDGSEWCNMAEELPEEEVNSEQLKELYTKGRDYRKKYWDKLGDKYFTDDILKKYYKSTYNWSDFEDDLEAADNAMNTQINNE